MSSGGIMNYRFHICLNQYEMPFFQYQGQYVNIVVIGVNLVDTTKNTVTFDEMTSTNLKV